MTWTTLQRSKLTKRISGWTGGEGESLLLIHGVGMRADYWSNLVPKLAQHFALTIIDLPGHGSSPLLVDTPSGIRVYTDCIAELLTDLQEPVYVAGHSMGALICIDLADRYSSKVAAITVMNGVFRRSKDATQAVRSRADELNGQYVPDPEATLMRWFGDNPIGVDASAEEHCRHWLMDINASGYQQAYRTFAYDNGPTSSCLESLDCAALFITGEKEPNSTASMSEAMAQLAPKGECHIVKGAKHMMSMTHGDEVCDRMIEFFEAVAAANKL